MFHFRWVRNLHKKLAATTIRSYLLNCRRFFTFLREDGAGLVRLSQAKLYCLERALTREIGDLRKEVTTHRQRVRAEKGSKYKSP